MTAVDALGWLGMAVGTALGLPQLVRLLRTRSTAGVSVIAWQAMLAINLGWALHGLKIGQPPMWVGSVLSLLLTAPILKILADHLRRPVVWVVLPGLAVAGVMVAVDHLFGSAAYGAFAIIPATFVTAGQSVALVRAPHVVGVSPVFLTLALANQVVWLAWAVLIADPGTILAATVSGAIAAFNVVWLAVRAVRGRL